MPGSELGLAHRNDYCKQLQLIRARGCCLVLTALVCFRDGGGTGLRYLILAVCKIVRANRRPVSYTHLRAHETSAHH
eukprot:3661298-Alexandrium_andersonii.AAC.1